MLLILVPLAREDRAVVASEGSLSISHIVFPLPLVPIILSSELFTHSVTSVSLPLPHVQLFIVVIAMTLAFTQIVLPLSMVLVIAPLLLIRTVEDAFPVLDVSSLHEDLALVIVTIPVSVLNVDSVGDFDSGS